jgi:hypothetical protein
MNVTVAHITAVRKLFLLPVVPCFEPSISTATLQQCTNHGILHAIGARAYAQMHSELDDLCVLQTRSHFSDCGRAQRGE